MPSISRAQRRHWERQLPRLIEEEKKTHRQAAAEIGCSPCWVQRACARLGLETQRTGPRAGALHPQWRGGTKALKGYRYVYLPSPDGRRGRYVAEHRLVMERAIGRKLLRTEVVHHVDGNPLNNSPDNLLLFQSNADHLRHELMGRMPNFSPSGLSRIPQGIARAAATRHQGTGNDRRQPQDDGRRT